MKDEVAKQWRADEVAKALAAKAADLVKQISAGGTIADAAKSAGAEVKTATDIHRAERGGLPESVVAAVFSLPADGAGSAATPDGRVVFKITADTTPPVDSADARVKSHGLATLDRATSEACSINMSRRCSSARRQRSTRTSCRRPRAVEHVDEHPAGLRSLRARL